MLDGVVGLQRLGQGKKGVVLGDFKKGGIVAFEFDAHRKIVAVVAAQEFRGTGMPRAVIGTDKLDQIAIALDQEVGRYPQVGDRLEIGVSSGVKLPQKKLFNECPSVLVWGKADAMNHPQSDRR